MQQHHVETTHVQNMQGLLSSQLPLLHCEKACSDFPPRHTKLLSQLPKPQSDAD